MLQDAGMLQLVSSPTDNLQHFKKKGLSNFAKGEGPAERAGDCIYCYAFVLKFNPQRPARPELAVVGVTGLIGVILCILMICRDALYETGNYK